MRLTVYDDDFIMEIPSDRHRHGIHVHFRTRCYSSVKGFEVRNVRGGHGKGNEEVKLMTPLINFFSPNFLPKPLPPSRLHSVAPS